MKNDLDETVLLSKDQIKQLHKKLLDATGGLDGIREEGLLDSALSFALQTFDGMELYPSFTDDDIIRIGLELANGDMDDQQLLMSLLRVALDNTKQ